MSRLPEEVEGDGVSLRRYRLEDAEALHRLVSQNIEHLRPWMEWISFEPVTLDERRELIETWTEEWASGGSVTTGIWRGGVLVGSSGLHRRIGPDALEIGYWVSAAHVGQGIA